MIFQVIMHKECMCNKSTNSISGDLDEIRRNSIHEITEEPKDKSKLKQWLYN